MTSSNSTAVKRKKHGVLTIEAALVVPIVIFLLILAIDLCYLTYLKASSFSQIREKTRYLVSDIYELTNTGFNSASSRAEDVGGKVRNRLERTLFDNIYLNIDEVAFSKKLKESLIKSSPYKAASVEIDTDFNGFLGYLSLELQYKLKFKTIFSELYEKINPKICETEGKFELTLSGQFDCISTTDLLFDYAKKNKNISQILQKIRGVVNDTAKKIRE